MTDDRRPDQADPTPPAGDAGAPAVPQWAPTSGPAPAAAGVWSARPSQPARRSVLPEPTAAGPVPGTVPTPAPPVQPQVPPPASPAPFAGSVPTPTAAPGSAPLSPYAAGAPVGAPAATSSSVAPRAAETPLAAAPVAGAPSPLPSRQETGVGAAAAQPAEPTATSGWAIVDPQTAPASSAPTLGVTAVRPPLAVPGSSAPVARATGTADASDGAASGDAGGTSSRGRPRWVLPVSIGAGVLLVGGVVAGVLASRSGADEAPAAVASTVQLPSPTPTIDPVAREATTPFATVLPASLLQYALTGSVSDDQWLASGALEAYVDTYDDGAGAQVVVHAGQWETAEEAAAFGQQVVEALHDTAAQPADEPSADATATAGTGGVAEPRSGDVVVDGQTVGSYVVTDLGDGTSVAVWWNGTTVFQLTGPTADIGNLYAAYPL